MTTNQNTEETKKNNQEDKNAVKFGSTYGETVNRNKKLHWMVTNFLYYGNCSLDAEVVLHYKIKDIEKFYYSIFGLPVTIEERAPIGAYREPERNRTFIGSLDSRDAFILRERYRNDEDFAYKMNKQYDADSNILG